MLNLQLNKLLIKPIELIENHNWELITKFYIQKFLSRLLACYFSMIIVYFSKLLPNVSNVWR